MWQSHYADSPLMAYPLFALVLFVCLFALMVVWVMATSAKKRWHEEGAIPFDNDEILQPFSPLNKPSEGGAA